jgi:hypothetical protein
MNGVVDKNVRPSAEVEDERSERSSGTLLSSLRSFPADTFLHLPDDVENEITPRQNTTGQYDAAHLLFDAHMLSAHHTGVIFACGDLHLAHATPSSPASERDATASQTRHALKHGLVPAAGIVLTRIGNQNVVSHFNSPHAKLRQQGGNGVHDA